MALGSLNLHFHHYPSEQAQLQVVLHSGMLKTLSVTTGSTARNNTAPSLEIMLAHSPSSRHGPLICTRTFPSEVTTESITSTTSPGTDFHNTAIVKIELLVSLQSCAKALHIRQTNQSSIYTLLTNCAYHITLK